MALATYRVGQMGPATFEYTYDDALMRTQAFRCINAGALDAYAEIARPDRSAKLVRRCPPGTTTITVPQVAAGRIVLTARTANKLDGMTILLFYPAPEGT